MSRFIESSWTLKSKTVVIDVFKAGISTFFVVKHLPTQTVIARSIYYCNDIRAYLNEYILEAQYRISQKDTVNEV